MIYTCKYKSPLGEILLAADEIGLTGFCLLYTSDAADE